jgi:zeaxanthin glucosyltransferase
LGAQLWGADAVSRILFCIIPEKGHINPYIGPAQHLQAAGHEVAFYACNDISEQLDRAGLSFIGSRGPGHAADLRRGAAFAAHVRDPAWLRQWIKTMLLDGVPPEVESLHELFRRWRPTLVAIDPMVYAAAIAAQLEGLPWAALSNSLNPVLPDKLDSELLATVRWLAPERARLFAGYGLNADFRGCDLLSPHLTVAFTSAEFVGRAVPGVELVGPSLPLHRRGDEAALDWERLDPAAPLVYMSLGSQIYYQPTMFRKVIEAVSGSGMQLVLSAAELLGSDQLPPLPAEVHAVRYAPQLTLLQRAAAFITHGGANSVMEALACGVPLLISPLCNDQFHQAHFIEAAGVGRRLDLEQVSPQRIRSVLEELIAAGSLRQRAAAIAASYRRDGAAEAARLLSALAAGSPRATTS